MEKHGPRRRKRKLQRISFWSTVTLIVLEFATALFLRDIVGDAAMVWLAEWIWLVLAVYLAIEFLDVADRDSTDWWGFAADNAAAFVGVVLTIVLLLLHYVEQRGFVLLNQEWHIMLKCLVFGAIDLGVGLILALRIAFAGKEREEIRG